MNEFQQIKRDLQLLRAENDVLEKHVVFQEQENFEGVGSQPCMYSVIGSDGEEGIPVQATAAALASTRFSGNVTIEDDCPFVWTHLGVTYRFIYDEPPASSTFLEQEARDLAGVFGSVDSSSTLPCHWYIGVTENGSGRNLIQGAVVDSSGTRQDNVLIPAKLFDVNRAANPNREAPLHGPQTLHELASEVLIPTSGSLSVEVMINASSQFISSFTNGRFRFYATFLGYKITS